MLKNKLKKGILKKVALIKRAHFFHTFQTTFSCSLKNKYIEEEIKLATEQIDFKNKPKKKKIGSTLLLIFNFIVIASIFIYFFTSSEMDDLTHFFENKIKWSFLALAVGMLLVTILLEALRYTQLIYKSTGKFRLGLSIKTHMLGKYYDNITPFAVGGQPFQIFYLNKHNIKGDKATSIPLVKHMINTLAFLIISLFAFVFNLFSPFTTSPVIIVAALIGCVANGALIAIIFLLSVTKRFGPSMIIKILKLGNKLRIVKNYKVTFFKVSRFVKSYQKSVKSFAKSKRTLIIQFLLAILTYIAFYSIVYFIYLAFIPNGTFGLITLICCMAFCELCSGIMPLPGGSGAAEFSFGALMSTMFVSNPAALPFAMLSWRILTYFIFIIVGGIQIFCSFIKNKRLSKKMNK